MRQNTLAKLYTNSFRTNWNLSLFNDYHNNDYSYAQVAKIILSLNKFYDDMGLKDGDHIASLGRNSTHWSSTFLSVLYNKKVIVPILPDFTGDNINHILEHSDSKLVLGDKNLLQKIDFEKCKHLKVAVDIKEFTIFFDRDGNAKSLLKAAFDYFNQKEIKKDDFGFQERDANDKCVISYTSGTSGFSKGVIIPERSLTSNIVYARDHMPLRKKDRILSFLPLAHVYGLLFEFLFPATLGCHITFLNKMPSPAVLTAALAEVRPHLILSVPLIIDKIYRKKVLPQLQKPVMKVLLKIPGLNSVIYNKVKAKLLETFGGRFYEIVIGGAPLSDDVEKFFKKIKFPLTVGYGMTECGPLISYAAWDKTKQYSAGKLVDRMELRIDSEDPYKIVGEIQVKGDNIMLGYYKNEQATTATFTEDGWLKTGDLGVTDNQDFVFIKGRSKNMLLGPSGQNIYPEEIEAALMQEEYIAEAVVVDRSHKLVALVFPDYEAIRRNKVDKNDIPALMEESRIEVNKKLQKYENITKIELVEEEFEKTPKKNIRRYKYL